MLATEHFIYNLVYDFGNVKEGVLRVWNNERFRMARKIVGGKTYDESIVCSICAKNRNFLTV